MDRRYDIDWLRVGAVYLLFVFHVGKVFDPAPFYHVRNGDVSFAMLPFCGFISLWHMPLLFLLAGWSAVSSLRARGSRAFMQERMLKLALPLVAGCVLLGPVIKYFELRSGLDLHHDGLRVGADVQDSFKLLIPGGLPVAAPFTEGFWTFLPTFYTQLGRFTWAHLWFVAYLLAFTVLYRPVFSWLISRPWGSARPRAWWIYAPTLPLAVIQVTLRPHWPGIQNLYDDWANVAYYTVFLLSGAVLACAPTVEQALQREWKRAFAVAVAAALALLAVVLSGRDYPLILLTGSAVAGWCFVVAWLGLAHRLLSFTSARLAYLSESAFPVYVLHQVAIVVLGYGIVRFELGIGTKYALLLAASLAATLGAYHLLVRPFSIPRLLLGMKPKSCALPRRSSVVSPRAAGLLFALLLGARPVLAGTPEGLWYAEGGAATVRVVRCAAAWCGRVESLRSPFDEEGCALRDRYNPSAELRSRPVEGLEILRDLAPSADPNVWDGGSIYDPTSGRTFRCRATLDGDRLRLRGYLGVPLLGRTTTWVRVGAEHRMCAQARP